MSIGLEVKINNEIVSGITVPTISFPIVFTWVFTDTNVVGVDESDGTLETIGEVGQKGFDIKISDNDINWGESSFVGVMAQTDFLLNTSKSWIYRGTPLQVGTTYYGQIVVRDEIDRFSDIYTFSFILNSLPIASNVIISPTVPTIDDELILLYDYTDVDGDIEQETIIRWYKNGILQINLNGLISVTSEFLQIDDVWYVDVMPFDGHEYGLRISSQTVVITRDVLIVSNIRILPELPNENDILKADYSVADFNNTEHISIRWFVNNILKTALNDQQYIREIITVGDVIRFEIKPESNSQFVSSEEVTIVTGDFIVSDILIDGLEEPLEVTTTQPVIRWNSNPPDGGSVSYVSVKIGTFFEADNIYEIISETNKEIFTVPANLLNRGVDYYVSVAISDTQTFTNYTSAHFRIQGSRWTNLVDNSTGWTIETIYLLDNATFDSGQYQVLRINDGSRFAEIRLYNEKISFVSQEILFVENLDTSGSNILTVVGKLNDIKIYLNRTLIIDASGKFVQESSQKQLDLGNMTDSDFTVDYKYFYYTVSGAFYPGESDEYANMKFSSYFYFPNNEVVTLKGYIETYSGNTIDTHVFAINPHDDTISGKIYSILPEKKQRNTTVSRAISPINKLRKSPDGTVVAIGHAKGISIVSGYLINPFDYEIDFEEIDADGVQTLPLPDANGWELRKNTNFIAAYFDAAGFNINTLDNSE